MDQTTKGPEELTNWSPPLPPVDGQVYIKSPPDRPRDYRGAGQTHKGVDLPAPVGTTVLAIADGSVYFTKNDWVPGDGKTSGNWISVQHPDGVRSEYMHLSEVLVKKGDKITGGMVIGKTGQTGGNRALHPDSDDMAPHLHFSVVANDTGAYKKYDPTKFVKGGTFDVGFRQHPGTQSVPPSSPTDEGFLHRLWDHFFGQQTSQQHGPPAFKQYVELPRLPGLPPTDEDTDKTKQAREEAEALEGARALGHRLQQENVTPESFGEARDEDSAPKQDARKTPSEQANQPWRNSQQQLMQQRLRDQQNDERLRQQQLRDQQLRQQRDQESRNQLQRQLKQMTDQQRLQQDSQRQSQQRAMADRQQQAHINDLLRRQQAAREQAAQRTRLAEEQQRQQQLRDQQTRLNQANRMAAMAPHIQPIPTNTTHFSRPFVSPKLWSPPITRVTLPPYVYQAPKPPPPPPVRTYTPPFSRPFNSARGLYS